MVTEDTIDLLASKLRTPLQVQQHLKLALDAGFQTGAKPVPVEVAESVLSKKLDDLEPTLTPPRLQIAETVRGAWREVQ